MKHSLWLVMTIYAAAGLLHFSHNAPIVQDYLQFAPVA